MRNIGVIAQTRRWSSPVTAEVRARTHERHAAMAERHTARNRMAEIGETGGRG